jgi:hypothetical protein
MRSMRSKANRRSLRTLIQFILGGGFLTMINATADGLSTRATALILGAATIAITWVQNYAEDHEIIPTILPAPPPDPPQA